VNLEENAPLSSDVMLVQAVDGDIGLNGLVEYSLSDDVIDLLWINQSTGLIRTRVEFDRELTERFEDY